MRKIDWMVVLLCLTIVFMSSMWAIDMGASGMNVGKKLTNGFWTRDPAVEYHIGLFLAIGSYATTVLVAILLTFEGDE